MNKIFTLLLIGGLLSSISFSTQAQDTTTVQTFDFNDITKRRGKYKFPDGTESYRKVLMRYNLKCDARTTRDRFDCGEWDYLTYTYIHGTDGKVDSTKKTRLYFYANGKTPDSLVYTSKPFYDYWRDRQFIKKHSSTTSLSTDTITSGNLNLDRFLNTGYNGGRSQYIFKASELTAQGMTAGNISGIQLDVRLIGDELRNLEIRMGATMMDSLTSGQFDTNAKQVVYRYNTTFKNSGYNSIQFLNDYAWNGTSNIVIEFRYKKQKAGAPQFMNGGSLGYNAGMVQNGQDSYLEFSGGSQQVNLGKQPVITGVGARTVELWARVDVFNNGGLFQAGQSGTRKDFGLRTTKTDDKFRAQLWGVDFDFTYAGAKGKWLHYAMTYDGTTAKAYVNGVQVGSKTAALITPSVDFKLGRWQGSSLTGAVNELRVWDKALSAATIAEWANKSVNNNHPDYSNLIGYYPLNEGEGQIAKDISPKKNTDGALSGIPAWKTFDFEAAFLDKIATTYRPNIIFEKGVYASTLDSLDSYDSIARAPINLLVYGNPDNGVVVQDNDPNHPNLLTRNELVWSANDYANTYDKASGRRVAWKYVKADKVIHQRTKEWYSPNYRIEIARYITPYGIGLDLGPDGYVWWYDVTDYLPLLKDSVEISSGNQQELIDLQFLFIKGEPAREVLSINRVWGQSGGIRYADLSNDTRLSEKKVVVVKGAESHKVKMRLTGHGHNSNDGSYPHCCEWKDNQHTLLVNGQKFEDWHIWKPTECAENPVYPQGGNWVGAREGWCPADVVYDSEFEIGKVVTGDSVALDYDITKVPANNQGMGNGNYVVAAHLIQYGSARFTNDAEVYSVQVPTNDKRFSRIATVCDNPKVVIRNGGSETLKSLDIYYRTPGGDIQVYNWIGSLEFMEKTEVELPVSDVGFYSGTDTGKFNVKINNPNGKTDEYADNNEVLVDYTKPEMGTKKMVVRFKTNNRPAENWYQIKDVSGKVVFEKKSSDLQVNAMHMDTIDLAEGCYSFYMHDSGHDGLYYRMYRPNTPGSGTIMFFFLDDNNQIQKVKNLNAEFGRSQRYAFTVGKELGKHTVKNPSNVKWPKLIDGTEDRTYIGGITVFPNPSKGLINVEFINVEGDYKVEVFTTNGKQVYSNKLNAGNYLLKEINLRNHENGIYILKLSGENGSTTHRVVLNN